MVDSVVNSSECASPVRGQCSFYADCLEARYHCGPTGYPLGYGEVYCNKFVADESLLSSKGQKWMLDTMECLQDTLVPEATGAPDAVQTCAQLDDKAFNSHPGCYVDNGLCWLSFSDWFSIVKIVGVKTLVGNIEAANETARAAGGCLDVYAQTLINTILYL